MDAARAFRAGAIRRRRSVSRRLARPFGRGGLKRAIFLPFAGLIVLGFGVAWTSYFIGSRSAVLRTADLLAAQSAARLRDRLGAFLETARGIAEADAAFIAGIRQPASSIDWLRRAFRLQLLGRKDIDLISVGFADGEYAEAQRLPEGRVRTGRAGAATGGDLVLEGVDEAGGPAAVELRRPGYDPRQRPWYTSAARAGRFAWSEPYALLSTGEFAISAGIPVYREGRLFAVVTADLRLGAISDFLASAAGQGCTLVADGGGRLLAASTGAAAAAPAFLAAAAAADGAPARARSGGVAYRVVSLPAAADGGLDWLVLVALPERVFLGPLALVDLWTGLSVAATLAGALLLALLAARRVARPLQRLSASVSTIDPEAFGAVLLKEGAGEARAGPAAGFPCYPMRDLSLRDDEIGALAQAFGGLCLRLAESFASLRSSLAEKEVLLKEVHHRVKNNLQIVSSLISLQTESSGEDSTRENLAQIQDRVLAMAFVHEDMYASGDFGSIRMDAYLRRVCDSLGSSRRISCPVAVGVDASDLRLPLEKALLCGLIVNELASEALRKAYAGRERGELRVRIASDVTECRIEVTDDGSGHGAEPSTRHGELGAQLVEGLASQLRGRVERVAGPSGTTAALVFPASGAREG